MWGGGGGGAVDGVGGCVGLVALFCIWQKRGEERKRGDVSECKRVLGFLACSVCIVRAALQVVAYCRAMNEMYKGVVLFSLSSAFGTLMDAQAGYLFSVAFIECYRLLISMSGRG